MKFFFSVSLILTATLLHSQNLDFKKYVYEWPNGKPDLIGMNDNFMKNDLVVINESVKINVTDRYTQTLTKNSVIKINSQKGVEKVSLLRFPESFDIAADKHYYQQGRSASIKVPYIYKFKIIYYAARIMKPDGRVINVPLDSRNEKKAWIDNDGTGLEDYIFYFANKGLEEGDILEYSYKIEFNGRYGHNLFYFHDETAKQNSTFEVKYCPVRLFENYEAINNSNGADSIAIVTSQYDEVKGKKTWIYTYNFTNLPGINYPLNSRCGKQLPHIFIDISFISYYGVTSSIPDEALVFADRGPKFEWLFNGRNDSLGFKSALYDKHHAGVRKFISKISSDNEDAFYTNLCDSLNAQKFISAEAMKYGENAQYSVSSGEWLSKGKLMEEFIFPLYWDILNEKKKTTYFVKIQDKRLGEMRLTSRAEYKYEHTILGVPNGRTIRFIYPRYNSLKYNSDELPFYVEGVDAALMGVNYQYFQMTALTSVHDYHRLAKVVNFIKTPGSTENENVRTESASLKVISDSSLIHLVVKESLNGQFSTIIRPLYLKDAIDSTVQAGYFKKCTDKPNAKNIRIKNSSRSSAFPFKYTFNCSEDIHLEKPLEIPLYNWFSFTFNKKMIEEGLPAFDYYFDFKYADVYNYQIQFDKPVTVDNAASFQKSLNNKYFEVTSHLVKQTESSYLLSVSVKVKQEVLPVKEGQLLLDFVNTLDELNNMVIQYKL
jgi:hypothetical protein